VTEPSRPGAPVRRPEAIAALLVILAATLPYASTLHDYFVQDDFGVVSLLSAKPWTYFPKWFVSTWMDGIWGYTPDEVRPFPALSYQLTSLAGADSVLPHHLFNVGLHAATALLVMLMARHVAGLGLLASAFGAVVFAVLPVQAESVAWITGRVDSMPAFFYIASFLAYARWRQSGATDRGAYGCALVLFGVTLFTKQNAITLTGTLAAYDLLIARPRPPLTRAIPAWFPFAAMTFGYLLLRFFLFGEVAREGSLNEAAVHFFSTTVLRHLNHVVFGDVALRPIAIWGGVAAVLAASWVLARKQRPADSASAGTGARLLFFGPVWWLIGVAPILVAGYESPRHVYLASAGWAVVCGIAFETLWNAGTRRAWRVALGAAAGAVITLYVIQLHAVVTHWNDSASLSRIAVQELEQAVLSAPPGTLFIVGAPTRTWEWSLPFAVRPPFTRTDLTTRSFIVSPWFLHCCRSQWYEDTRRMLREWSAAGGRTHVIAIKWVAPEEPAFRLTDSSDPSLRAYLPMLSELSSPEALNAAIVGILNRTSPQ
jgi:hypothetical protein